jgi:branched-chain amino acid transport system permease protein
MEQILVFSFAAAAIGGFDSVFGAVVGGMIVGVADALTIGYVDALHGIDLVVPFGLILLVLLFRPAGLFGTTRVERV